MSTAQRARAGQRLALAFALVVALLASGCTRRSTPAAPGPTVLTVWFFSNGFHSGVLVPTAAVATLGLDPQARPGPWLEIGFGETAWTTGDDRSFWRIIRLVVWRSEGVFLMEDRPLCARSADYGHDACRYWRVELDAARRTALLATLDDWIDRRRWRQDDPDDSFFYRPAKRTYHLSQNCHDFTADAARAAGLPIARSVVASPLWFEQQMDLALGLTRRRSH